MTTKLLKRLTSVLVCIAMLLGLFPVSQKTNKVYAAVQDAVVTNPGFEDALTIPGWEVMYNADCLTLSNTEKHTGNNSLKIVDTGSTQSPAILSQAVAVKKGDVLGSKFFAKVNKYDSSAPAAMLIMCQFKILDGSGNVLGCTKSLDIETATGDTWTEYTVPDAAVTFDNAASAQIMISGGGSAQVLAYFDDMAALVNSSAVQFQNQGFEDAQTIPGWDALYNADCLTLSNTEKHTGNNSLKIVDTGADQSTAILSKAIAVKKGDILGSRFFAKVNKYDSNASPAMLLMYQFRILDAGGNLLGCTKSLDMEAATGDTWTEYTVTGSAITFDNAESAQIMISGGGSTQVLAYIDDVAVTIDPAAPPVIVPEVIVNNNCSSLTGIDADNGETSESGNLPGFIEPFQTGWYGIDSGLTYGTDIYNGISTNSAITVNNDETFFHHDITSYSSGSDTSSFTIRFGGNGPYVIGNSTWNMDFKIKINEMANYSSYSNPKNGFSIFFNTDKGYYRVVFSPDNKIRVLTPSSTQDQMYVVDAGMTLADKQYHVWSLYGDGTGKMSVACDGKKIGDFENARATLESCGDYDGAGSYWNADGVGIRSYLRANNTTDIYTSGSNEVYLGGFSLTKNLTPDWSTQEPPFVPQEYSNIITETDCSSLKAMSDAKWSIDPVENGVYVNDKDNTLGNTIAMKSVEEGKMLLYHDGTPGVDYIYALKYANTDNKIGDNAWTLKLNMNLTELMKFKNYNDPRSGLSFLVFTGTRLSRLTFCADNKLLLNTGNDASPSISSSVNLHMDGEYHNWMISKTKEGKLYVTCDGDLAAKFDTDGFAYPGDEWTSPGLQILTYCSGDYDSGKTEVYFDDIKLSGEESQDKPINLDFETPQNADGTIPGWNQWYGTTGFSETTEDKNSGAQSLLVNDDKTDASFWLLSRTLPANPGEIFELNGYAKVLSGSLQVNVTYLDENNKMVKYFENEISSPLNQWVPTKVSGIAPAGTTKVAIFIYSGYGATGKAYVDDLQLSKVVVNGTGIKTGTPVNLGEMVKGRALDLYSITSRNTATGEDELYTVSTGASDNPSVFYVLDPLTGKVKWSQAIPNTTHLYGIVKGSDNNIYFAGINNGILFRYLPTEQKIESVGTNPSAPWVWDLAASNDGKIYGATAGDTISKIYSKIFEYDIATDTFKDLGPAKDGVQQARGLGVTDNYLYVGVGTPDAVIKIDRKTMERTEITTGVSGDPERMGAHVWAYNDRLFIRDCAMKLFVMDEATDKQINELSFQQAISAPSPYDNNILYYKSKNEVWEYHFDTNTANPVVGGPRLSDATSNALNWFKPITGEKAGKHLLGITDDSGGYVVYDPIAKTVTDVVLEMVPQAVLIVALEKSPDGKLYVGGYQYGSCIYDPKTQKIERIESTMHQPEGIGFLNGKTYYGTYGSAIIYSYDPAKPYAFNPVGPGNPGIAHDIESKQDRPFALTSGDNKLFVGTIPDYGLLGGALTVYDEQLGTWEEYRNVVQDQSITGLAYKDGLLYGSTSVDGGLGSTRTAEEAKIFVWDVAKKEKIKEVSISIPGMATKPVLIGELTFGTDGLLWGAVDGALFAMNPKTFEVVKSRIICTMNYAQDNSWRPYFMKWGADGLLYTTVGRKIVVFDTGTEGLPYDILVDKSFLGTIGNDGNIYYTNGSSLMMLPVIRQEGDAVYAKGVAINAAKGAIDMLPGYYNITLNNKAEVQTARNLVNVAKTAGAADSDIPVLSKLAACEKRITDLIAAESTPTPDAPTPAATTTPTPTPAAGTIIKVPEKSGDVATANVTTSELTKAFDAAKAGTDGIKKVVIEVAKVTGAEEYVQKMPADFFTTPSGNKNIEIKSPVGTIIINDKMFEKENLKKAENVAVKIGVADISNLDKKAKDEIGSRPVIEINAMIDGKVVSWKNSDAPVQISIAYTPTAEELKDPEHITVYYIDGNGKLNQVTNGRYDTKTGMVTFTTTHFSKYAISYVNKTFNDIGASPAKREIEVLASKGIINGTSAQTFSPKKGISRADYLLLVLKALDLNADFDNNFSDVKPSDYYYQTVGIAKKLGITVGCGNNCFNPKGNITRQEMLALTARALKAAGKGELKFDASDKATREDAVIIIYSVYNK